MKFGSFLIVFCFCLQLTAIIISHARFWSQRRLWLLRLSKIQKAKRVYLFLWPQFAKSRRSTTNDSPANSMATIHFRSKNFFVYVGGSYFIARLIKKNDGFSLYIQGTSLLSQGSSSSTQAAGNSKNNQSNDQSKGKQK